MLNDYEGEFKLKTLKEGLGWNLRESENLKTER